MAPGPLGVGWARSFGKELGPRRRRIRKPYLPSRDVPFLLFGGAFSVLLCSSVKERWTLGEQRDGATVTPSPLIFFLRGWVLLFVS